MPGLLSFRRRSRTRIPAPVAAQLARGRHRVDALTDQLSAEALASIRELQREAAPFIERTAENLQREAAPYLERAQREAAPYLERAQREAAPYIERATGRKQRRGPSRGVLRFVLLGVGAAICYVLWQRRDPHPAYLVDEPEHPSITPAGSPSPTSPARAPSGSSAVPSEEEAAAALRLARSMVDRELAGTHGGPAAHRETREPRDVRESRREGGPTLPSMLGGMPGMPWASSRPQMPGRPGPSLPY